MSKPAQPKGNFLQTMLIITTAYLGLMLYFNKGQATGPVQTTEQLLTQMVDLNAKRYDIDIVHVRSQFDNQIDTDVKAAKLTAQAADKLKLQALLLTADCQLKAGIHSGEISRLENAYNTIAQSERKRASEPIWNQEIVDSPKDVALPDTFPTQKLSGHGLHEKIVETLSVANKKDLVWGVIPGYQFIDTLVGLTGRLPAFSYAFAAFILAVIVRASIFKLSMKQIMYGRQMSQLSPLLKDIKEKFPDQQEQQVKTMELYKEYGINPFSGCYPALIQLPLFITVYRCMLHYRFDFQKGVFLWINQATAESTKGLVAANLGQQDNILIIIYGLSMVASTLLMPVTDPTQVKQQKGIGLFMAIFFTGAMFFGVFPVPSAFVLYWTFTNILATAQSLYAYRQPLPELKKVNAPNGGSYPFDKFLKSMNGMNPGTNGTNLNGGTGKPAQHKPKKRK